MLTIAGGIVLGVLLLIALAIALPWIIGIGQMLALFASHFIKDSFSARPAPAIAEKELVTPNPPDWMRSRVR